MGTLNEADLSYAPIRDMFYRSLVAHRKAGDGSSTMCPIPCVKITEIQEVDNEALLKKYIAAMKSMEMKYTQGQDAESCQCVRDIRDDHGRTIPFLKMVIGKSTPQYNEAFLFHGPEEE